MLSFLVTLLTLHRAPRLRALNWTLALLVSFAFISWIAAIFASDAGVLPSVIPLDFLTFPLATVITLYLVYRLFGDFIVWFCLFCVIYFFTKGYFPQ